MRASKIAAKIEHGICKAEGQIKPYQYTYLSPESGLAIARCLARLESAVEALAADAGTGPARRIKAILDGEEGT